MQLSLVPSVSVGDGSGRKRLPGLLDCRYLGRIRRVWTRAGGYGDEEGGLDEEQKY